MIMNIYVKLKYWDCQTQFQKNKKFHWLLIDQDKNVSKLTLEENKREFKEGKLEINDDHVKFNDTKYKIAESNEKLEDTIVSIKKFIGKTLD